MVSINLNRSLIRLTTYTITTITILGLIIIFISSNNPSKNPHVGSKINHFADTGYIITDLEIKTCTIFNSCSPKDFKTWFKIPKPLNYNSNGKIFSRLSQQYIFIQKRKIDELNKLIHESDSKLKNNKYNHDDDDESYKVMTSLRVNQDGEIDFILENFNPTKIKDYYLNLDVLFGEDAVDPRPNWNLIKSPIFEKSIQGEIPIYLTFKTFESNPEPPKLTISSSRQKNYKIIQVADLHFSTHEGICRDQFPEIENCKADQRTLKFLNQILDIESPDLVLLTGDQIFGEDSFDSITTLLKVVNPFVLRKIPFAFMFGNHDDEGSMSRSEIMQFLESQIPYSLSSHGPTDIDGVGNYIFQLFDQDKNDDDNELPLISFYVLDSHKYSPNPKLMPGYDWIKESQLEYIIKESQRLSIPQTLKHLSFGLFHIPLPEHGNLHQGFIGNYKEAITAPRHNSHARDVLQKLGISIVTVGHDHCNDYCVLDSKNDNSNDKIWLCYGGAMGEGGYGGYGGTTRRLRIFNVDLEEMSVQSYKRLETSPEKSFDHQILVTKGEVVSY
ncbi:hypothetical protein WICMUC_004157 [Wickerhamomyces mucosus]|uniref:Calcineurin-like phosphoesterase domain-containing protein n=1 Tax=Wickerhamomyces mucosus TaxID=1378264 RepID=A0A9P8TB92_9ASCO|nr:hypothetical protein WICMUC_004157 [Wickerhamomyces mucosus]